LYIWRELKNNPGGIMKRVLIVGENVNDKAVLAYYISKYFFCDIYTASNSMDALERMGVIKPDVIIADITFPVKESISFIREILIQQASVPVIALSAVSEKEIVEEIKKSGKLTYLPKPVNSYRIYESLEGIFNFQQAS
jgi:response regulator of citrate/malate metabolism